MFQSKPTHCFGHPFRFVRLQRERIRSRFGAESARPRTALSANHYATCSLTPALPTIWALRRFANGMQRFLESERVTGQWRFELILVVKMRFMSEYTQIHKWRSDCQSWDDNVMRAASMRGNALVL